MVRITPASMALAGVVMTSTLSGGGDLRAAASTLVPAIGGQAAVEPVADLRRRGPSAVVARFGPRRRLNPVTQVVVGPSRPATSTVLPRSDGPNPPCCKK